ncbi:AAA domain protein [Weizmannia phage Youna2]
MKIKIKNTAKKDKQDLAQAWLNILIYGDPGAGKTYFVGTANDHPETANVLLLDAEAGRLSLEQHGVDYVEVIDFEEVSKAFDFLVKYCAYRDIFFNPSADEKDKEKARLHLAVLFGVTDKEEAKQFEPPLYKTVAIDSLTEIQKINMSSLMKQVIEEHPDRDPDVPSLREWGKSGNQIREVVRAFRGLKMHTIFLALPTTEKDEKTGEITMLPSLPGKLAREIPGYVDIVGFLQSTDDNGVFKNQLYVRPFGKHTLLKDRTSSLGNGISMPTMGKIFDKWDAKRKGKVPQKPAKKEAVEDTDRPAPQE